MIESEVRRGEVWLVDWSPGRGSGQLGLRPSLIVQNDIGNMYASTTIVAAISGKVKKEYPFQLVIRPSDSGLSETRVVNLDQLRTIDRDRLVRRLGRLPQAVMGRVDAALKRSLGLD